MLNNNEPDIVITEADLDQFTHANQDIANFFANPQPKPMAPIALVETKCITTKRKYWTYFEKTDNNTWTIRNSLDDTLSVASASGPSNATIQTDLVSGSIDWSELWTGHASCPYCATKAMAQCGSCRRLSCHRDGKEGSSFSCAWCGQTGVLQGIIKTLDGSQGKKKKR